MNKRVMSLPIVRIMNLEDKTMTEEDMEKIVKIFNLSSPFFLSFDKTKITPHADYIRHVNTECEYQFHCKKCRFSKNPIDSFIISQVQYMFLKNEYKKNFFTVIFGTDLTKNSGISSISDSGKGLHHLNLCWFEFEFKEQKGWIRNTRIIKVKTMIVLIYVSPFFVTMNDLYKNN